MKRIPGIKPRFVPSEIRRPDGTILKAWEMFVGERSFGRSDSKEALLSSWEARLEEAENGRPFAFRPLQKRTQRAGRDSGATRSGESGGRAAAAKTTTVPTKPAKRSKARRKAR